MPQSYYFSLLVPIFVLTIGCTENSTLKTAASDTKAEQKNAKQEDPIRVAPVSIRRGRPELKDQVEKQDQELQQQDQEQTPPIAQTPLPKPATPAPGQAAPSTQAQKSSVTELTQPVTPAATNPTVTAPVVSAQPLASPAAGGFLDQCYCD